MDSIYVDHGKLQTCAADLAARKSALDEVLSQLESDLAPMISTWSGEARELYLQKKKAWDNAARDISDLLGHIGTLTDTAFRDYCEAVSDVHTIWS